MKSPYTDSLSHTTFECKYHIVFAPKYRRKEINEKILGVYNLEFFDCFFAKKAINCGNS